MYSQHVCVFFVFFFLFFFSCGGGGGDGAGGGGGGVFTFLLILFKSYQDNESDYERVCHKLNSASSGIQTQDLMIQSRKH